MPKKLLIFSPFFPPHIGGLENYVYELSRHLSECCEVIVFTSDIPKTKELECIKKNLKVIRYPAFQIGKSSRNPIPKVWKPQFWRLLKLSCKNSPNCVISQTRFFFSSFLAYLTSRVFATKYMHVEHGSSHVFTGNFIIDTIAKIYDLSIGSLILRKADGCIAISESVYEFSKQFRKKEIKIIKRGLNAERLDSYPPNREFKNRYKGKTKIYFIGRLTYWKGLHNALDGFLSLPSEIRKNCIFFVVGDGPERDRYRKEYKDEAIIFVGRVSDKDSIGIPKACDIFVHPTLSGGGLATTLLEAMYLKKAIIASPMEGAKEALSNGKNGILLKTSSPTEFRGGFEKLIGDKKLQKELGKNAKKDAIANFSWDEKIEEYLKLFKELGC